MTSSEAGWNTFSPSVLRRQDIAEAGFPSKEAYAQYLAENTGTPSWLYWQNHERELEQAEEGVEPYAGYLKLKETGGVIPVSRFNRGRRGGIPIEIIITGGSTNPYWFGGDFSRREQALKMQTPGPFPHRLPIYGDGRFR
ncbi:MAG: hypothetical protein P8Z37_12240 [Acidobacteriota bacterium]